MAFTPTTWVEGAAPGISAAELNRMEAGIDGADAMAEEHDARHEPGGADPMAVDAAAATGSLRRLGTSAQMAAAGNDARLHTHSTKTRYLWLPPEDFLNLLDNPALITLGTWAVGTRVWKLHGDGTAEGLTAKIALPSDWSSGTVKFTGYYEGPGPDVDNRRIQISASAVTPGVDSVKKAVEVVDNATVAHGNSVLTTHTFATGLTVAAGDIIRLAFARDSGHGDDLNTDAMYFCGMRLEYTAFI